MSGESLHQIADLYDLSLLSEPSGWATPGLPGADSYTEGSGAPRSPLDYRPRGPQAMVLLRFLPQGKISDPFRFATFYTYFALVLSALILSCFREKPPFFSPKNMDPVSFNGVGW